MTLTPIHVVYVLDMDDLPVECIAECSAQGAVDEAIEYWVQKLSFTVDRFNAIRCLKGYGTWSDQELADATDETIAGRILWLACCDFKEGDSLFVLE